MRTWLQNWEVGRRLVLSRNYSQVLFMWAMMKWNQTKVSVQCFFLKQMLCIKYSWCGEESIFSLSPFSRKNKVKKSDLVVLKLWSLCDYQYFVKVCYNANFYNGYKLDLFYLRNWIMKKEINSDIRL